MPNTLRQLVAREQPAGEPLDPIKAAYWLGKAEAAEAIAVAQNARAAHMMAHRGRYHVLEARIIERLRQLPYPISIGDAAELGGWELGP